MIQFHELRMGDFVLVQFDGKQTEGEVIGLNGADREIQVRTGDDQEFWYTPKDLYPIALTEDRLMQFGFEKQVLPDGKIKYLRGPFRILLSQNGNFSDFEMWYREDRRHMTQALSVHGLQNHFHQMTKIDLTRDVHAH
jgi:hypothetical protein